jgi:hypothetical protein
LEFVSGNDFFSELADVLDPVNLAFLGRKGGPRLSQRAAEHVAVIRESAPAEQRRQAARGQRRHLPDDRESFQDTEGEGNEHRRFPINIGQIRSFN